MPIRISCSALVASTTPREIEEQLCEDRGVSAGIPVAAVHTRPFAGLSRFVRIDGKDILSTTIIVGEPNPLVAGAHSHMPVMLMAEGCDRRKDSMSCRTNWYGCLLAARVCHSKQPVAAIRARRFPERLAEERRIEDDLSWS